MNEWMVHKINKQVGLYWDATKKEKNTYYLYIWLFNKISNWQVF